MSLCPNCRAQLDDETMNDCPTCGTAQPAPAETPATQQKARRDSESALAEVPLGLTKREFFKSYSRGAKKCFGAAIIGYISVGATAVAATGAVPYFDNSAFLGANLVLILSLLIHLLKSRIASLILLVCAVLSVIIGFLKSGTFYGWIITIEGILAVIGSFSAAHEWKMYQLRSQNADSMNADVPTAL